MQVAATPNDSNPAEGGSASFSTLVAQFYREDASFPYDLSTTSFSFFADKRFEYINTERGCESGWWWDYYTRVEGTWTEEETTSRHVLLLEITDVERTGGDFEAHPDPKTFWSADGRILKVLTPGPLSPESAIEWSHLKFYAVQPPQQQQQQQPQQLHA